jgi:Tfp pilus assembly protein FimT
VTRAKRGRAGFTVVEMAINLAIVGVIVLALGGTWLVGYTAIKRSTAAFGDDTAAASASLSLSRDIASAASVAPALPVTLTPGTGLVTFTPAGTSPARTYKIDAQGNLLRTVGASTTVTGRGITLQVAAGSVSCQLQVTITPSRGSLGPQTLLASRRTLGC